MLANIPCYAPSSSVWVIKNGAVPLFLPTTYASSSWCAPSEAASLLEPTKLPSYSLETWKPQVFFLNPLELSSPYRILLQWAPPIHESSYNTRSFCFNQCLSYCRERYQEWFSHQEDWIIRLIKYCYFYDTLHCSCKTQYFNIITPPATTSRTIIHQVNCITFSWRRNP